MHSPMNTSGKLVLEVCAGTARLSAAIAKYGVPTLSVDYDRNRHCTSMPIVKIDLSVPDEVSVLLEPIEMGLVEVLTAAPPCGTASRAREIKLNNQAHGPPPLRSSSCPWGLPGLSSHDQQRVDKANSVYRSIYVLVSAMLSMGKSIIIENPLRSYLWDLPPFSRLLEIGCFDVCLQNCKFTFGTPSRAKWSRFRTNIHELKSLGGPCRQTHQHLGWGLNSDGSFATAEEAAYPVPLCSALANAIVSHINANTSSTYSLVENCSITDADSFKKRKLAGFSQPRGKKLPPLVSEFSTIILLEDESQISDSHKLLRYQQKGGDGDEQHTLLPVVGVFRDPFSFVEEAKKVIHPLDRSDSVDSLVLEALLHNLELDPAELAKNRVSAVRELVKLVHDTKLENDILHSKLSVGMKKVLRGKQLVATQKLLERYSESWPDTSIVQEIVSGAKLTGMHDHSGIFPFVVSLPTLTVSSLKATSFVHNSSMLQRTKSSGDDSMDNSLWEQTLDEVSRGWLQGPFYDMSDVCSTINDTAHLSRRFAIQQSSKIRAIDDFHESNINSSYGYCDKLQLMDIDSLVATIRIIESICAQGVRSIIDSSGNVINLSVNEAWLQEDRILKWQGATLDLKSAYKQIAVAPSELWSNVITVFDPLRQTPAMFIQHTLPFGATASVMLFNRIARFLWFLGCKQLKAVWHNFYDDYPTVSPTLLASSTKSALEIMIKLLGWHIAEDDKKAMCFSEQFSALGVCFDISDVGGLGSFISNTEKRKRLVLDELNRVIEDRSLSKKLAEVLVGKLQFMESHCFGRLGRSYLRCIRKFVHTVAKVQDTDIDEFRKLADWLESSQPRRVSPKSTSTPLLFTDGACEYQNGKRLVTCGAIVFPSDGSSPLFFGFEVPSSISTKWSEIGKKDQLVTEAELFPVLVSLLTWKDIFAFSKPIIFVDSEPAKHCLIRGTSDVPTCADIVKVTYEEVDRLQIFPWFTRVPSKSNPADPPSRLDFETPKALFKAKVVSPVLKEW